MRNNKQLIFALLVTLLAFGVVKVDADRDGLRKNFYQRSCPQAEKLVRDIIGSRAQSDPTLGAKLLRMFFHDCFVRGCDASLLLDTVNNNPAEKDARPNLLLLGFDVIEDIKTQMERVCPGVVSCADILALATRDSVSFPFKRSLWDVPTGRRDGNISLASEVDGNIPSPLSDFDTLMQIFSSKGFSIQELVVLSGAHTIGVAHCATFMGRLYNFTGKGDADPSLNATYAEFLRTQCPNPADPATTVELDPQSSRSFDKNYFNILLQNKGLLQSDAALLTNRVSSRMVRQLSNKGNPAFFAEFSKAMKKMGALGVLTGAAGEIRKQCRIVNS